MVTDYASYAGEVVYDSNGDKIGSVDQVYVDDQTGQPEWLSVRTGMFGGKVSFVPLSHVQETDNGELSVPYTKDKVKDAPRAEADGHLEEAEERALYEYYGVTWGEYRYADDVGTTNGRGVDVDTAAGRGTDVDAGRRRGTASDDAMTRSEEELRVDTVRQSAGRARLRKYVVTEQQTVTVPVQREVARLETEPITDANVDRAMDGPEITENEHEVTLSQEEVRVDKVAVPKERVRLTTDTVTEDRQVTEEVRKERIEADGDIAERNRDRTR
jgi:uncharacterized protein (TIGR02271 family)